MIIATASPRPLSCSSAANAARPDSARMTRYSLPYRRRRSRSTARSTSGSSSTVSSVGLAMAVTGSLDEERPDDTDRGPANRYGRHPRERGLLGIDLDHLAAGGARRRGDARRRLDHTARTDHEAHIRAAGPLE